ncbi:MULTISPECIES: amino acid permease [Psychrilyobacter]|uniref:Amino acid permease n=1 Tax=Psychrilyobacter piezotolerans TaxID=2293438 RepID=A0ABX9KHT8_9FUSO|nr:MULTISPECIES: amino acid permease [Psychrilyobacter]MCS5420686.1 amino acid permease [Psychrilyobacter sp. S5]NDI77860.1 amino acid permease [Psychrilyobacter piezotolerans]RDE62285.1 amino acid permease [Psychrilyobacter sp. S5]REI41383.1 amino acid permease [Psychrilyobacter piezotolerans]
MEKRFGTFNGVFLPTFLTIIGVIFYLRFGWIVGNAGILGTLGIVVLAHIITISTAFSMASITTNMEVKGGGAYFLISRSLGLEIGGSIGIPLYLSQVISVSLYILGFIESVKLIFPDINTLLLSVGVTVIIGVISSIGADLAVKMQYGIFCLILLSLGTIVSSGSYDYVPRSFGTYVESGNFWMTFAVFFPAVTGILAGVSMSGDLTNPRENIPKGTFYAIGVTFLIYTLQIFWFGFNIPAEELISNKLVLISKVNFPVFIIGGIWAATLSSALGSMIAAPRTMQALAKDSVLPSILGRGSGKANEPRIATFISFIIAFIFIIMVNLNFVAPVITMFFLNTYGAINMVVTLEKLVGNPSFRPTFKTHWVISLIGAFGSYSVMFLINFTATIICLGFTLMIYLYISKKNITRTWGDLRDGLLVSIIRMCLLRLRFNKKQEKNWKPDIIVFSGNPKNRSNLIYLANHFSKGRGIITLVRFIFGHIEEMQDKIKEARENLDSYLKENKILAFSEVVVGENMADTFLETVQSSGIGLLKPNTVLMGMSRDKENIKPLVEFMRKINYLNKNTLVFCQNEDVNFFEEKNSIDIWWRGLENNGNLMLTMAHLIALNDDWEGAKIRLLSVVDNEDKVVYRKTILAEMLVTLRVDAQVEIIVCKENINKTIKENSSEASLVLIGLSLPEKDHEILYYNKLMDMSEGLNSVLFVRGKLN